MSKYSEEFKESVVRKMMPPENKGIAELSRETGVSEVTLYKWRDETRRGGRATPAGNSELEKRREISVKPCTNGFVQRFFNPDGYFRVGF